MLVWIVAATCLLHLPILTLSPGVNHDEAMLNAAARNWSKGGAPALTPLADFGATYRHSYYWHPPGHLVVMTGAYHVFGFSVATTRGVSLASVCLMLGLGYLAARRLAVSRPIAVACVGLLLLHPQTLWLARSGRMDGFALALGFAGMLALPLGSVPTRRLWCISGLLIGVGSLFHIMVLAWAPALWFAQQARLRRGLLQEGMILAACAAAPVTLWVAAAFLRGDGPAWIEQFWRYQILQRKGSHSLAMQLPEELGLMVRQFRFEPLVALAGLIGLGWSVARAPHPEARFAKAGVATAFVLIGLGTAKGTGVYPLYWFSWLILAAALGYQLMSRRLARVLLSCALLNGLAWQGLAVAVALYQREARDPGRVEAFFAAHLPPRGIVVGPEDIWYAVEKAGCELRIWVPVDSVQHDFYVTHVNAAERVPPGFELVATLPDIVPKVFGKYFSHTAFGYKLWRRTPASPTPTGAPPPR